MNWVYPKRRQVSRMLRLGIAVTICTMGALANAGPLRDALALQGKTCPTPYHNTPGVLSFAVFPSSGIKILVAAGEIHAGDGERLTAFVRSAGRIDEVWLDSPGGDAAEGIAIGEAIRAAHLAVRVPAGFSCISSCSIALLGGIIRRVDPGASYGVHTFFASGAPDEIVDLLSDRSLPPEERFRRLRQLVHDREQGDAILATKWQVYAQKMGISRDFLTNEVVSQKSLNFTTDDDIMAMRKEGLSDADISKSLQTYHCPSVDTLRKYNVINAR